MTSKHLVIIPTYNEAENIGRIIPKILALKADFDVLVVDDNSPDGTGAMVKELQPKNPPLHLMERKKKSGLGTAYIAGFKWALAEGYDFIYEMDADFSHKPKNLLKLRKACDQKGFDIAVGSRYIKGVNVVNWPIGRVLLSYFASSYVRIVAGMPVRDATAGFVCYKRQVLETLNLDKIKFIGYAFQIEMKYLAWRKGFTIKEIPIIFRDRKRGKSKMSGKIMLEGIWGVVYLRVRSLFDSDY